MTMPGACVSKRPDNDLQCVLPRITETQKITPFDHLREAVLHAHADMRVAIKMQRRGMLIEAWQKIQQGHDRLGKALDTVTGKKWGHPCGDEEGTDDE